ncbi:hypothetical protein [Burkholderia sp. Ac-20379]|uniref:hypothetical protein n=1 Tax=Burkholderia sp. Ac-20379 TaxID=2703900 RepID=UPI0019812C74|nr:hypothetical protein [Burkholderia sp. Ac-20379]MBN3723561.1 hypothetical protein [Burkholderia sp. Ac-20379]
MGRPRHTWRDDQLRAILAILPALERDFPQDNAAFLDALIAEIRLITGRVFGAGVYDALLKNVGPQTGVTRRPSSATVQAAVGRAHAAAPAGRAQSDVGGTSLNQPAQLRDILAPVVRDALAPLHALFATHAGAADVSAPAAGAELTLTRAALKDAHARIRQLEAGQAQLRQLLGAAEASRDLAGAQVKSMLSGLLEAIHDAGTGATELATTAQRLAGTEQFLKLQQDAVRQQANVEADALRLQVSQLRDQVGRLQIENDHYRRALSAHRSQSGPR